MKKLKLKKQIKIQIITAVILTSFLIIFSNLPAGIYLKGKFFAQKHRLQNILGLSVFRLPVKYHRQEHSLSCEIASLKMALSGVGIEASENDLIKKLKFDPTPKIRGIWGDPYNGFVGDIDGKMGKTGYGVYWEPIEAVAKKYTYAESFENATPQFLAEQIALGRPVVIWGFFGRGKALLWQTPQGSKIQAIDGEHARTLAGFAGSSENPEGFFVFDPIYGEMFWTVEELMQNSSAFKGSGVVVYPQTSLFGFKN